MRLHLAARFFALLLTFSLAYLYSIYTPQSSNTSELQNNQEQSENFGKTENNREQQQQKNNRETTEELRQLENNQCGLIVFVHINKCGGGSLSRWFKHHATGNYNAAGYLLLEDTSTYKGVTNASSSRVSWENMVHKATSFVNQKSQSKNGWKVLHLHHGFPGVYYCQEIFHDWQAIVEGQGCAFHKTTVLRDPLDRFVSNVNWDQPPLKDIDTFMESRKNWLSRYFLFGICGYDNNNQLRCGFNQKGNFTMTPNLNQTYVKEIKKIITTFDSIGFTDMLGEYMRKMKMLTGWRDDDMIQVNNINHKSLETFNLTTSILKKFLKLNQEDYYLYYTIKSEIKPPIL